MTNRWSTSEDTAIAVLSCDSIVTHLQYEIGPIRVWIHKALSWRRGSTPSTTDTSSVDSQGLELETHDFARGHSTLFFLVALPRSYWLAYRRGLSF